MRTEDLIAKLAADAVAVERLERPMLLLARWLLVATTAVAAGVALFGARPDVAASFSRTGYVALWLATLATGAIAGASAWLSAIPGAGPGSKSIAALCLAAGTWAALLVARLIAGGSMWAQIANEPPHFGCVAQLVAMAAVPAALLYRRLRRAAPLAPSRTGALAALAALALAAAGSQIVCPLDSAAHHLPVHFLPTMLLAALSVVAASTLLGRLRK